MGNSEVGHLNLGAGAVVKQDLTRIDDAIADGSFFENEVLLAACAAAEAAGRLHLLGLVSEGGVHASMGHLRACIELAKREGVPDVVLHAFTDGRDTLPTRAPATSRRWRAEDGPRGHGHRGATSRWTATRAGTGTKLAYDAMVHGRPGGARGRAAGAAVRAAYERDETDEFIKPTVVGGGPDPRRRQRAVLQLPARIARAS